MTTQIEVSVLKGSRHRKAVLVFGDLGQMMKAWRPIIDPDGVYDDEDEEEDDENEDEAEDVTQPVSLLLIRPDCEPLLIVLSPKDVQLLTGRAARRED